MDERLDDIINSEIMDIETSMNILINAVQSKYDEFSDIDKYLIGKLTAELDINDNNWMTTAKSPKDLDLLQDLPLLSAQYDNHIKFELTEKMKVEYEQRIEQEKKGNKVKKSGSKNKVNF